MASGLIAVLPANTTLTFTAPSNMKLLLSAASNAGSSVSINGVSGAIQVPGTVLPALVTIYLGEGQTITITPSGGCVVIVSSLEEWA